jgi:hypothetical protein
MYAQRKAPRRISGRGGWIALPDTAKEKRRQALNVVALMRREDLTLATAARRESIPVHVVEFYAHDALSGRGGTARATAADRLYRPMRIVSGGQNVDVDVRGSRVASLVGEYWNGVHIYLDTGDDELLRAFAGKKVAGYELETDPDVLDELARRGMFEFDSIYRLVA